MGISGLLNCVYCALWTLRPCDLPRNLKSPKKSSGFDISLSLVALVIPEKTPENPTKSRNPKSNNQYFSQICLFWHQWSVGKGSPVALFYPEKLPEIPKKSRNNKSQNHCFLLQKSKQNPNYGCFDTNGSPKVCFVPKIWPEI